MGTAPAGGAEVGECIATACTYYRTAGGMLLGVPLDPRLMEANQRQTDAFRHGAALLDVPPEIVEIPYDGIPAGYFFRATPDSGPRPTLALTEGTTERSRSSTS